MITLLYGPDGYRRDERRKSLMQNFGAQDVRAFDAAQDISLGTFREFIRSSPLFSQNKRLGIVSLASGENEGWNLALKEVLPAADLEIIVVIDEKPKGSLSFLLKKPVQSEFFEYLKGSAWKSFIEMKAKEYAVALSPEALHAMIHEYEKNTWGLITELEKLRGVYHRIIYPEDLILARNASGDFWTMINQLKSAERRVRLKTLENALAQDDPAKIFYILSAQLKGRETAVAHADLAIKSGKVDFEEALLGLLL